MDISTALALVVATVILVLIPGPNLALFIANTLSRGWRVGAVTVLGTCLGIAVQLGLVLAGLGLLLAVASEALLWVKWAGVAYLIVLGILHWRTRDDGLDVPETARRRRPWAAFLQGLGLSLLNPKTLLFNAAFVPQFLSVDHGVAGFVVPVALYLSVILIGDLAWVTLASRVRPALQRLGQWRHRLTGSFFFASGVGLALARGER